MNFMSLNKKIVCAFAMAVAFSACSKKTKDAGDSADNSATSALDANAPGTPIPELGTILFAYDSFALSSQAKSQLNTNAQWLKSNASRAVQVEGHCDERGTEEYNLALGDRRSSSVKEYLISQGVAASQLSSISYGEERPADPGHDESAWSRNRRASFVSAGN